ncbi:hypothetical protein Cfor_09912 [Coptotermes formosanus]|uniref:Uncharacterized protein n=1 Tax=Coptotermes formosanus TaxID=36987 RepID=A0A6L2PEK6_COPFO|nr:hypothetical protein Cfor_09912 [Coptotermes formosanus]
MFLTARLRDNYRRSVSFLADEGSAGGGGRADSVVISESCEVSVGPRGSAGVSVRWQRRGLQHNQLYSSIPLRAIVSPTQYSAKTPLVSADSQYDLNPQYSYSYSVNDASTGDSKSHGESRSGDLVQGSYSVVESDSSIRRVDYSADDVNGFNAVVHRAVGAVAPPPVPVKSVASVPAAPLVARIASSASAVPALAVKPIPEVTLQSVPVSTYRSSPVLAIKRVPEVTLQTVPAATYKSSPVLAIRPVPEVALQSVPAATYKSSPVLAIRPVPEVALQSVPAATYKSSPVLAIRPVPEVALQSVPAATYKSSPFLAIRPAPEVTLQSVPQALAYSSLPAVGYESLPVTQQVLPSVAVAPALAQPASVRTSVKTPFASYEY